MRYIEGQLGATGIAKEIGHKRKVGPMDLRKKQSRSAGGNHSTVDLRNLLIGFDRHLDGCELARSPQPVEESPQIGESRSHVAS